jgi:hypothetical protein
LICREAAQQVALPRAKLAGRKGQAVQLLLQQGNIKLMQVRLRSGSRMRWL